MAAPSFSRSRSPVMSIRTQPEEENTLRAEIEAASRTQHDLLPRYSWHSSLARKDNCSSLRQTYPSVLQKDSITNQLITSAPDHASDLNQPVLRAPPGNDAVRARRQTSENKKPWRQFTRRKAKSSVASIPVPQDDTTRHQERVNKRRADHAWEFKKGNEGVADEDRAAQHAQFNAWLEERMEEQNAVADLAQLPTSKTRRTLRKSVYGSLSSTKSFFRGASIGSLEKLYSRNSFSQPPTPHVYSFETKDQLRDYLNDPSVASPLSPIEQSPRLDACKSREPVELSGIPIPVELEGNSLENTTQSHSTVSRTSTPSLRDLPPYIDDKKFVSDIAKDQGSQPDQYKLLSPGEYTNILGTSYTCTSCLECIDSNDIYDFCAICDTGDRVLCTKCAERGPCCRHELEDLLRTSAVSRPTTPHQAFGEQCIKRKDVAGTRCPSLSVNQDESQTVSSSAQPQDPIQSNKSDATYPEPVVPESSSRTHHGPGTEIRNAQLDFLKEMGYMRREQSLIHWERELTVRAREIEVRDQQATLREREGIIQQRSDLLMRKLEAIASCQGSAQGMSAGSRSQSQYTTLSQATRSVGSQGSAKPAPTTCSSLSDVPESQSCSTVAKTEVAGEAGLSIYDVTEFDPYTKSAAQKRKKDASSRSSGSTPAAASSPEQPRKTISRNNSEHGNSQDEEDEEDEDHRVPKKSKQDPPTPIGPQRLFACPYSKNDPVRFSSRNMQEKNYRGCATHYLPDVSRLKQHLKRVHWQPDAYCPRCFEEFDDIIRRDEHCRAYVACVARDCPFPEKMDKPQQNKIHVKRPKVPPETVWFDIYKVLFPGSPLPESPYMEDDRMITPSSATPQSAINIQATQMLSNIFNHHLDRYEELQNNHMRPAIHQALTDSFTEVLGAFSLSPTASPGAGPSIVVSPVSRSSSETRRAFESPPNHVSNPPKLERKRSITDVISQPQHVPRLQEPRPPRPKVNTRTALQVPNDHHRSPLTLTREGSLVTGSPVDVIFDVNILPHIQDDQGYDDECRSFEQGDDLQAMAFVKEPDPPAFRNKSARSIDSGYGSGKYPQHPLTQPPGPAPPIAYSSQYYYNNNATNASALEASKPFEHSQRHLTQLGLDFSLSHNPHHALQDEYNLVDFESYSNYLDQTSQDDIVNGIGYDLSDPSNPNPWSYP